MSAYLSSFFVTGYLLTVLSVFVASSRGYFSPAARRRYIGCNGYGTNSEPKATTPMIIDFDAVYVAETKRMKKRSLRLAYYKSGLALLKCFLLMINFHNHNLPIVAH